MEGDLKQKAQDGSAIPTDLEFGATAPKSHPGSKPASQQHPSSSNEKEIADALQSSIEARRTQIIVKQRALIELQGDKELKMFEYRRGEFCSGCSKTRSEILAEGGQFPHPGQHIVAATAAQLAQKEAQFDGPIKALQREIADLKRDQTADLRAQMFDEQKRGTSSSTQTREDSAEEPLSERERLFRAQNNR